jgi:hypothetical protein
MSNISQRHFYKCIYIFSKLYFFFFFYLNDINFPVAVSRSPARQIFFLDRREIDSKSSPVNVVCAYLLNRFLCCFRRTQKRNVTGTRLDRLTIRRPPDGVTLLFRVTIIQQDRMRVRCATPIHGSYCDCRRTHVRNSTVRTRGIYLFARRTNGKYGERERKFSAAVGSRRDGRWITYHYYNVYLCARRWASERDAAKTKKNIYLPDEARPRFNGGEERTVNAINSPLTTFKLWVMIGCTKLSPPRAQWLPLHIVRETTTRARKNCYYAVHICNKRVVKHTRTYLRLSHPVRRLSPGAHKTPLERSWRRLLRLSNFNALTMSRPSGQRCQLTKTTDKRYYYYDDKNLKIVT